MDKYLQSSRENFSYLLEMTEFEKDLSVLGCHTLTIKCQLYGLEEKKYQLYRSRVFSEGWKSREALI